MTMSKKRYSDQQVAEAKRLYALWDDQANDWALDTRDIAERVGMGHSSLMYYISRDSELPRRRRSKHTPTPERQLREELDDVHEVLAIREREVRSLRARAEELETRLHQAYETMGRIAERPPEPDPVEQLTVAAERAGVSQEELDKLIDALDPHETQIRARSSR